MVGWIDYRMLHLQWTHLALKDLGPNETVGFAESVFGIASLIVFIPVGILVDKYAFAAGADADPQALSKRKGRVLDCVMCRLATVLSFYVNRFQEAQMVAFLLETRKITEKQSMLFGYPHILGEGDTGKHAVFQSFFEGSKSSYLRECEYAENYSWRHFRSS